ncbi:MAG TPA: 6-phosphogluconolactonase [Flavisolibacter sp.]|nr:6-phosphogluconolactonase [Flavisolibacter sp.]
MKVIIEDTYEAMSRSAAEDLLQFLQSLANPLICVASGASPAGLYKELVRLVKASGTDTSNWNFVGLDEWKGMNGSDEDSSRDQLNRQLFAPLNITEERICFFDGRTQDDNSECQKTEEFIGGLGGIDVAILGIGVNGHIGLNEPGTSAGLRSHVAAIHPSTQQIGQKYFKEPRRLDTGLTLGLATLLEAKHLMLLASGTSKTDSVYDMLHAPESEAIPSTLIRHHENIRVYLDKVAAERLG